ncbi:hypothetical protein [Denitratimonas sp. CY0512]|uniref:hypothetical protein n=1 Tax=Denitratimonas sp. CY0512 TaxID=3131940 RepID=UPI0030B47AEE
MSRHNPRSQRRLLAEQAARWMSEHALDDPAVALRRMLARLPSAPDRRQWPDPAEILDALRQYQRLFRSTEQPTQLEQRREAAAEAMRFFSAFRPRLVGAVLEGTADANSPVQLHLHGDDGEALLLFLQEQGIAHRVGERSIHLDPRQQVRVPHVTFQADELDFELWLLPLRSERQAPLEADGRTPMHRASLTALRTLG